jgi:hypothetical protein
MGIRPDLGFVGVLFIFRVTFIVLYKCVVIVLVIILWIFDCIFVLLYQVSCLARAL